MDWLGEQLSLSGLRSLPGIIRRRMESPPPPHPPPPTSSSPSTTASKTTPPSSAPSKNFRKCESATFHLDGATYTIVASPPERCNKDDPRHSPSRTSAPSSNGQLNKQGSLTIVRRSSGKKKELSRDPSVLDELTLDSVDLTTENLPAVDTPDACDKAALRLRCLLRQLQQGEVSAELLQRNLLYAARVLEAVFIDETKRLADEDDELSEVQPDAVPPEVREWLASTFTRQLATTKRKSDEKPKFRSVANAIRAGIFVDRMYRKGTTAALMQFPPEVVKVLKTLDEWCFDVFALNESAGGQPVKYLSYDLLNRYGILHKFKVVPTTLENFLMKIEEGYLRYKNPYHNNLHATDVAQTVHYMLCQTGLMNWLTDLEIFATLIAAVIHDFEHTGTTNNFHVMSGSDTALLYNDRAVLENHHISASFRLLREDDSNILQNLSREEFREFRTLVIDMVLATDMSFHFQQIKNMKNLLTLAEPSVDKSKALSLVLHCCDISHPAKRWDLHHRWTSLLLEEFFRQGDKERELGLPFSPLCDRNNTLVAESQIGFIDFIVEPSMGVCSDMLEVILAPIMGQSQSEANQKAVANENCRDFGIKKPWVESLAENKKIWKERAIQDAEVRDALAAEKEEGATCLKEE